MYNLCDHSSNLISIKGKGKDVHLYSTTGSMWPSYQQNSLHYLPGRATPPNLGLKIPEAANIPMQGGALTCLPSNAMALPVLPLNIYMQMV